MEAERKFVPITGLTIDTGNAVNIVRYQMRISGSILFSTHDVEETLEQPIQRETNHFRHFHGTSILYR
jgi:hypothetical protein